MKKSLALMLISGVAMSLTGCGSGSGTGTAGTETTGETPMETKVAAAQATAEAANQNSAEPELIFRYGEVNSEENIVTRVGYQFAEYVDELSNGRIRIEVYPNDALGDERTSLRTIQAGGGTIDMYRGNTNALTGYGFKKLNMFGLPYIFNDREGMWKVLEDEELGRAFLSEGSEIGAGMVGLFYTDEGARNLFTSREIRELEDIQNQRIRVPESVLMMDTISALSAQPIPMPYSELYSALQNGTVDGGENPLPAYITSRFYEVAPYYLLTGHVFSPGIVLMAEERWNSLSETDQQILLEAGRMASEWNKAEIEAEEEVLFRELEDLGVTVIQMSPEDQARAREYEEIVRVSFSPGLEDLLNRIIEIQR